MKLRIILFYITFYVVIVHYSLASQISDVQKNVRPSVWQIKEIKDTSSYDTSSYMTATGFFIGPQRVITNFHVIFHVINVLQDLEKITLVQNAHTMKIKRIISVSSLYDLALIETETETDSYLTIQEEPVPAHTQLFASGYPLGSFTEMEVLSTPSDMLGFLFFATNNAPSSVRGGESGSPLFNSQGKVMGVLNGSIKNTSIAVGLNFLNKFIKGNAGSFCEKDNQYQCIKKEEENIKNLANNGNILAQYVLGRYRSHSLNEKKQAIDLFKQASLQGYAPAQYNLGAMYWEGSGISKDAQQAVKWFRQSALQGYAPAQHSLGVMYWEGSGISKDAQQAVKWFRQSALQGYAPAQHNLGVMYWEGNDVLEKDAQQAVKWFRQAAQGGHAEAQYQIANMLMKVHMKDSDVLEKDAQQAVKWFRQSALQGYAPAQYSLGVMYWKGNGVSKDAQQAVKWFRQSALQDYAHAQEALSLIPIQFLE